MCMLSFYPPGVMPDAGRLENGNRANTDGYGFAIVTGRQELIVEHGLNPNTTLERFIKARTAHPEGPALFHSRWATSGNVDLSGCHPFRVGSDTRTVVAHNGVFFDPGKDSTKSDTAIFAESILPRFGLDKPKRFAKLERWVGSGNKLVILTVNPNRRRSYYLVNEQAGYWVDGEWHSNRDYEDFPSWRKGYSHYLSSYDEGSWAWDIDGTYSWKPRPDREPWPCDTCGARNAIDTLTLVCDVCKTCQDCGMDALTQCMCWQPSKKQSTG